MRFENTNVFNIDGAMRGMRFPMKGQSDTWEGIVGARDADLASRLHKTSAKENLAHSKFLRQILVSVDITAPRYWWSEMDTYKVGTTANSESTMHKIMQDAKNLTLNDFEHNCHSAKVLDEIYIPAIKEIAFSDIPALEKLRTLKQILPDSFLQKRHWTANYEVIRNIYNQRVISPHRLPEWTTDFAAWAESLPYAAELITKTYKEEV